MTASPMPGRHVLSLWRGLIRVPSALTPRGLICAIARQHGLTLDDLRGPSVERPVYLARQEVMYELRRTFGLPWRSIARACNREDHSTAWHGARRHAERKGVTL